MTHKSGKVAALVARFAGGPHDARYLGYFDCFNRGLFYEAHDVLEDLWLLDRRGPEGDFYRGLIQLAGAFVLIGKQRPRGARALFLLAEANLVKYPALHAGVAVADVLAFAKAWRSRLEAAGSATPPLDPAPRLAPPV